ncbi:MAG: cytochrome C oxidase assembly protein [Pseudomonadota bacterium]
MALRAEHEIHTRRKGRNMGVGLLLASFVVLILALTVVKVTGGDFELPSFEQSGAAGQ